MLSVIIATKDRADALKIISLPSLLRQESRDFEIIIWDASKEDHSRSVCEAFADSFRAIGVDLRYFKALRVGLAAQRNDSISGARGDTVVFIDDDCEMSSDGVAVLNRYFYSFPWLMGAGLPMLNKPADRPFFQRSRLFRFAVKLFWMKNSVFQRKIAPSSALSLPTVDCPGPAEWLSGGSMAYRKIVFDTQTFDERLQRFGGYSLGEDYDFSHRVVLYYGAPLVVTNGGYMVHHAAPGVRHTGVTQAAASYYNMALIRRNFNYFRKTYALLPFIWGLLGVTLALLATRTSLKIIWQGAIKAYRVLSEEKEKQHEPPHKIPRKTS